jgi:hypothetical protein
MKSTNKSRSNSRSPRGTKTGKLGTTLGSVKQKQMSPNSDLLRSFKATTSLALGLTKERIKIQNDL